MPNKISFEVGKKISTTVLKNTTNAIASNSTSSIFTAQNISKVAKTSAKFGVPLAILGGIGLFIIYRTKIFNKIDELQNKKEVSRKFSQIDKDKEFTTIAPLLIATEGIRSRIYNDKAPNIPYENALEKKIKGNYTVGVGHKIKKQTGNLLENLTADLIEAQKRTNLPISTEIIDEKLSPDQITMLFYSDLIEKKKDAKELFTQKINGLPESIIRFENLSEAKQTALISLIFNVGKNKVIYKKVDGQKVPTNFIQHIRNGEWEKAQGELDYSIKNLGIAKKRYLEMILINNGQLSEEGKTMLVKNLGKRLGTIDKIKAYFEKELGDTLINLTKKDIWDK